MSRLPSLKSVWLTVAASTLLALSGVAPAQAARRNQIIPAHGARS